MGSCVCSRRSTWRVNYLVRLLPDKLGTKLTFEHASQEVRMGSCVCSRSNIWREWCRRHQLPRMICWWRLFSTPALDCSVLQCVAVCCSVLQCVAVCCSVLQCVAVCYSVSKCRGWCVDGQYLLLIETSTSIRLAPSRTLSFSRQHVRRIYFFRKAYCILWNPATLGGCQNSKVTSFQ